MQTSRRKTLLEEIEEKRKGALSVHWRQGDGISRVRNLCTCFSCRERDQSPAGGAMCQPDLGYWTSGTKGSWEKAGLSWEGAGEPRLLLGGGGGDGEGLMVASCFLEET